MSSVQSRFLPPVTGTQQILRRRLLSQLEAVPLKRLTTIVAPAGYGKTSLGAQWHRVLQGRNTHVVWVSLEPEHADKEQFLLSIIDALEAIMPEAAGGRDAGHMQAGSLLAILSTRLSRTGASIVLFLDDYHHVQTNETETVVPSLLKLAALAHVKIVLMSRTPPRFPVSALKLAGEMREINVKDLGFSGAEAQELFGAATVKLTLTQIEALNQRTEGWAVALQMVRVLVNDHVEGDAILATFGGTNLEMGRYLSEQVFSILPEAVRRFLLETAPLPAVCRDLAAAVTSTARTAAVFGMLHDYAIPVALSGEQGGWVRTHPVFKSFLTEEAARNGIDQRRVLRAAARWFQQRGDFEAAVRHALLADDSALAAAITESAGGWRRVYATSRGGTGIFRALIGRAAELRLADFPLTTLGLTVICAKAGQLDAARHYFAIVQGAPSAREAGLARELRVVGALLSLYADQRVSTEALSALENDLDSCAANGLVHRALVLNMLCYNFLIRTDLDRALTYGRQAMRCFRDGGADFGAIHLYTHLGQAAFFSGDLAGAREAYQSLIDEAQTNIGAGSDWDAVGQVLLSEVRAMSGDLDAAAEPLRWALPHLQAHDSWFDLLASGFMAQQRVFRLRGDYIAAHAAIDGTRAIAKRRGLDRLIRLIDAERVLLLAAGGDIDEAGRYANANGLAGPLLQTVSINNFANHLRGAVPAMVWLRLYLARGDISRARQIFSQLMAIQPQTPHVPRQIELGLVNIALLLSEGHRARAADALSELILSQPALDYRALFLAEGEDFARRLRSLVAERPVSPFVASRLREIFDAWTWPRGVCHALAPGEHPRMKTGLTESEERIVRLLSTGLGNKDIGRRLQLSDNTVKFHLKNIFAKLNVKTRTGAVAAARETGVLH